MIRRCHRLDKPCPSQTPALSRRRKKEIKPNRVAELERRLEDLTSRMERAQQADHQTHTLSPPDSIDAAASRTPLAAAPGHSPENAGLNPVDLGRCGILGHLFPGEAREYTPVDAIEYTEIAPVAVEKEEVRSHPSSMSVSVSQPATGKTDGIWPTGGDADTLLAEYNNQLGQLFPFVVIPGSLSSSQLQQQRPYLWKAVMTGGNHLDGRRQISLGNALLDEITAAAITKPQKTLDLLQGLQVLICWFHYNLNSFQLTNLLYLARSLCAFLGLHHVPTHHQNPKPPTPETLEHLRAFVGTYYLVTVVLPPIRNPDTMMSTGHLDACLSSILARREYPSDELLVHLVRTQQLSQSISLWLHDHDHSSPSLPISMLTSSFLSQLKSLRSSVPPHLSMNATLLSHHSIATILLYSASLSSSSALPSTERLTHLWACLHATKSFFDIPSDPTQSRLMGIASFDFFTALLTATKLVTLPDLTGWDLDMVRTALGFAEIVDRQIAEMEKLADRRDSASWTPSNTRTSATVTIPSPNPVEIHQQQHEPGEEEDPYRNLASKLKLLKDAMSGDMNITMNEQLRKAASKGALTVTDATQGIVGDLEGGLWDSLLAATGWADWGSFG